MVACGCNSVPRQVFHVYDERGDQEAQLHGTKDAVHWYKRALYAICPSSNRNMDLLPAIFCKIARAYVTFK